MKMEPIRIGFTGNRNGLRPDQEEQIKLILDEYKNIIVLHGDCVGSDTDFHKICVNYKNKITIHIYPPNNPMLRAFNDGDKVMEEKSYLERNMDIVKNSDILIACPVDKNKEELRSGTWSTVRQAKKHGIPVYLF
jgi:hypothetical protein